jgi:hypothetical protein
MATASLDTAPVGEVGMCQDLGPVKLYSTLRSMTSHRSVPFGCGLVVNSATIRQGPTYSSSHLGDELEDDKEADCYYHLNKKSECSL